MEEEEEEKKTSSLNSVRYTLKFYNKKTCYLFMKPCQENTIRLVQWLALQYFFFVFKKNFYDSFAPYYLIQSAPTTLRTLVSLDSSPRHTPSFHLSFILAVPLPEMLFPLPGKLILFCHSRICSNVFSLRHLP